MQTVQRVAVSSGQVDGNAGPDGQVQRHPQQQEQDPYHLQNQRNGHHAGHHRADFKLGIVFFLCGFQQHPDIGAHGGQAIHRGIAEPIEQLGKAGMVTQHHEHGDEYRGENGPFCGAGVYQDIHQGADDDEHHAHAHAGEIDALEEVGAADGQQRSQVAPGEQAGELAADKAEEDKAGKVLGSVDHGSVHIVGAAEFARSKSKGQACRRGQQEQHHGDILQKGRADKRAVLPGGDAGKEAEQHQGQEEQGGNASGPQAFMLLRGKLDLPLLRAAGIYAEARRHDLFGNQGDDHGDQEGGGDHEIPVARHVRRNAAIRHKACNGAVGDARQGGVGTGDHHVGGKARLGACIGGDHAQDRILADAHV